MELRESSQKKTITFACPFGTDNKTFTCNISETINASNGCYSIGTISCDNTNVDKDAKLSTKTICFNSQDLNFDVSDAQQTIDYSNKKNTFQIKYKTGTYSTAPEKEVRIYDEQKKLIATLSNECNFISDTYTCTVTKNEVPSTFQGKKYNVKVVNFCGEEADPKITLLVKDSTDNESNSFFFTYSNLVKILFLLIM